MGPGKYFKDGKYNVMIQITEVFGDRLKGFSSFVCVDKYADFKQTIIDGDCDAELRLVPDEKVWFKKLHRWEEFDESWIPECRVFDPDQIPEKLH